jgi:hypothetical protein
MSAPFLVHHEIRFSADPADQNRFSQESLFHKIWVNFVLVAFFLVVLIFL